MELCNEPGTMSYHNGHKIHGYADDLVILAQGKYYNLVRGRMQLALNLIIR